MREVCKELPEPTVQARLIAKQRAALDAARTAVSYALNRMLNDPHYAYYMVGSETMELLIVAAAAIFEEPIADVRKLYADVKTEDPKGGNRA